ncbi:MAG: ribosomal-protein-serine acetyltransferase [Actinomycetota bacterium]|nr:ribosomal-protein-serine acetyltransferase [Actinomycetota bacterium]
MSAPFLDLGDGVELRAWSLDDAPEIFAVVEANRDHLRAWLPWVDRTAGPVQIAEFIERSRKRDDAREANGIYVNDVLRGSAGLSWATEEMEGEIGYWVAADAQGRGLATRAARALTTYGFEEVGLHRMVIKAGTGNTRSRAVAERLGFVQEGILREGGTTGLGRVDLVVYGLIVHEWTP